MLPRTDQTYAQKFISERINMKNDSAFLQSSYEVHGDSYADYYDEPYSDYYDTNSEEPN